VSRRDPTPAECFSFYMSAIFDGPTRLDCPTHLADLRKSGLTDETIRTQKFTDVPPDAYMGLLGFTPPNVVSAYLIPFADPGGGWMPHIRMRIFPPHRDKNGRTVKYLGPKAAAPRLYFPLASIPAVRAGDGPVWFVEGAKKAAFSAQVGLAAVGFEGIQGWHLAGTRDLLDDVDVIPLKSRIVELVPDSDVQTNEAVLRGVEELAVALARRGARPRLVVLPTEIPAGTERPVAMMTPRDLRKGDVMADSTFCTCGRCWFCARPTPSPVTCFTCRQNFVPDHHTGDFFCSPKCRDAAVRAWRDGRSIATPEEIKERVARAAAST
jgi:hypothetical protein